MRRIPSIAFAGPLTSAAALAVALGTSSGAAADILAFSPFNSGDDGWTIRDCSIPENANPPGVIATSAPFYFDTGGNPVGYIEGFLRNTSWWCFTAPPLFLGAQGAAFGGTLQFDMRAILVDLPARPGVFLIGAGMTLSYLTQPPTDQWNQVTVPLSPAGWRVNDWATGREPTRAEMQAVLSSLEQIYVTGQWHDLGISKSDLDNVILSSPSGGASSDLNDDGFVDGADVNVMLAAWGACGATCPADLNHDGEVAGADLTILLGEWSPGQVDCPRSTHSCYATGTPGCVDPGCCAAVCENLASCCTVQWDDFCVEIAAAQCAGCGNPSGGSCCSAHQVPYCSNAACCQAVCANNSFCCDVAWDDVCANDALFLPACGCDGP